MPRKAQRPNTSKSLPAPEFFWTPEQIAVMHQISKAAVFSAIARGDLKATKPFANIVRIADADYRAWLARTCVKPAAAPEPASA